MFLKQYNYKPRSNSGSGSNDVAVDTSQPATESPVTAAAARRRSSATEKFAGLTSHKRSSQDAVAADRRSSFADQKVGGSGVLGSMWQNFTKGSS